MPQHLRLRHRFLLCLAMFTPLAAQSHEFWIEPLDYTVSAGDSLQANLKVGQNFNGNPFAYVPDTFVFFDMIDTKGRRPVDGRIGDVPAVNLTVQNDGMLVLAQRTKINQIAYEEWAKFENFIKNHKLDWVLEKHRARGLPDSGFIEAYFRFAKTLVKVGDGRGQDISTGMPFELIALTNPYASPAPSEMRLRLLWQGKPFANSDVHVFRRPLAGGEATKTTLSTNANGEIAFPVTAGGEYLVNSVHIVEPPADFAAQTKSVWVSLWASETFAVE